jgi:hypothetical protein
VERETVITHLQIIHTWAEFARERDLQFFTTKHLEDIANWSDDAIALLKEQEAVVRCKDCKNSGIDTTSHPEYWCSAHGEYVRGDCYCWLGERKEGR